MKVSSNFESTNKESLTKFGTYALTDELAFTFPNNTLTFHNMSDGKFLYHRLSPNEDLRKIIQADSSQIKVEVVPVLPIHIPSYKTDFFFLRFVEPLFIGGLSTMKGQVSIPIEIGVFLADQTKPSAFDFFSNDFPNARFALYGLPLDGKLCKYATTSLEGDPSTSQPLTCAQLPLEIINELEDPVSINKLVFPVIDHDLYFRGHNVLMDGLKGIIKNRIGLQVIEMRQNQLEIPNGWSLASRNIQKKNHDYSMEGGFS
ncbi:MAG TPA: DUF432 domain-containing protein [Nitrosopumilaceae archaeon]|nr:DUF432 domain-containing protein [Nitrosopumilaceae archaeon]